MLTHLAPPQIRATTGLELAAGVFTQCAMEWWSVEDWSGGVLEYWSTAFVRATHHSNTPSLHFFREVFS